MGQRRAHLAKQPVHHPEGTSSFNSASSDLEGLSGARALGHAHSVLMQWLTLCDLETYLEAKSSNLGGGC